MILWKDRSAKIFTDEERKGHRVDVSGEKPEETNSEFFLKNLNGVIS